MLLAGISSIITMSSRVSAFLSCSKAVNRSFRSVPEMQAGVRRRSSCFSQAQLESALDGKNDND